MHLAEVVVGEGFLESLEAFFQIFQIALLALFDEREYDVDLSPHVDLASDALIERGQLGVELMQRLYGFSARRQFVDDTYIQVAVYSHGKGAWYRGCRHDQYMRWIQALAP